MEGSFEITIQFITAVVAGVSARALSKFLRIPSVAFLLLFGIILGSSGLGWLQPRLLGVGLEVIVSLSVALILLDGGLNLKLRDLGKVSASLRNLITIGALITLTGGGLAAHWLAEFPWPIAFLYASLVVVTGPTVINPILAEVGIDRRLATILEGEGVLIDAIGAALAVVVLNVVLNTDATAMVVVQDLVLRLLVGGAIGVGGGWLLGQGLKRATFFDEDTKSSVVIAGVLGLFGLAQSIRSESGLLAAVLTGLVLRELELPDQRQILRFKSQLTTLVVAILFILLSANLSLASLVALGWGGVFTVLCLMLVIRPLSVVICTWNSSFTWRQRAFMAWCAPRGIVAASVASLFAIVLTERGVNGGEAIKSLVFLTIAMTVFCQGLTAKWVARLLGLNEPDTSGVVIVGGNPLGQLLARLFQRDGQRVVIVDSSVDLCKQATESGIPAYVSNGMDARSLADAGLDTVGSFIAMTVNFDVNVVIAQRVEEEFHPPKVLAVFAQEGANHGQNKGIQQALGSRIPIKTWNQYILQREVRVGELHLSDGIDIESALTRFNALYGKGTLLPMAVRRKERLQIFTTDMKWEQGDRIIYLLYTPRVLTSGTSLGTVDVEPQALPELVITPTVEVKAESVPNPNGARVSSADYRQMARDILQRSRPQ
ncbi:MAG: sodium:proton antiporter [Oscillatoriales cyanobacterium SM2_2_1]|nr:sodium:proton antiporter [Oscillatoriales cyanobacterium SM2_2_1]